MKVVIDEGVPRHLASALIEQGIDASRFPRKWISLSNSVLIRACEAEGYDVLVTNDKNIADQQSLQGKRLAVVALPHNRRRAIIERIEDIADTLRRANPGEHIVIEIDGTRTIRRIVDGSVVEERLPAVATFRF
jgi:predicted nuclease of predicted toxin-antitoxin system